MLEYLTYQWCFYEIVYDLPNIQEIVGNLKLLIRSQQIVQSCVKNKRHEWNDISVKNS